jgi:uncharacterized membrane protein
MMEGQAGPMLLILVCILAIIAASLFIYFQMDQTKKFVRSELLKFAALVNDAQFNEFNFDKLTEGNIRVLDNRLKSISDQLKSLKTDVTTDDDVV